MPMSRCRAPRTSCGRISIPTNVPLGHFADPLTKALAAKQEDDIRERIAGNDERLRHLDEMGIDIQVVCPAPPQCYYTVPIEVGGAGNAHGQRGTWPNSSPAGRTAMSRLAACRCPTATRPPRSLSIA